MGSKRYAVVGGDCVACGCCVKVCPLGAVYVHRGTRAIVRKERCVGCGKCAAECPASTIALVERGAER